MNSKIEIPSFLKHFFISYSFIDKGIRGIFYSTSETTNGNNFLSFTEVRDQFIGYLKSLIANYDCKRDTPLLYEKSRNNNHKTLIDLNLFLDQVLKCEDELVFIHLLFTQLTLLTPFFERKVTHISLHELYLILYVQGTETRPFGHRSYVFLGNNLVSCNSVDFSLFYMLISFLFSKSQITIVNGVKIADSGTSNTSTFFNFDYTSASSFQTIVNQLFSLSQFENVASVTITRGNKSDRVAPQRVSNFQKNKNLLESSTNGGSPLNFNKNLGNKKFVTVPYRDKGIRITYNGKVIHLSEKFIPDFKIFLDSVSNGKENGIEIKKN